MRSFKINSADSINDFLFEVYKRSGTVFDPADDLRTVSDKNGMLFFTADEAEYLDNIMTECFIFCVHNNLNIYKIVHRVQSQLSKIRAVA